MISCRTKIITELIEVAVANRLHQHFTQNVTDKKWNHQHQTTWPKTLSVSFSLLPQNSSMKTPPANLLFMLLLTHMVDFFAHLYHGFCSDSYLLSSQSLSQNVLLYHWFKAYLCLKKRKWAKIICSIFFVGRSLKTFLKGRSKNKSLFHSGWLCVIVITSRILW